MNSRIRCRSSIGLILALVVLTPGLAAGLTRDQLGDRASALCTSYKRHGKSRRRAYRLQSRLVAHLVRLHADRDVATLYGNFVSVALKQLRLAKRERHNPEDSAAFKRALRKSRKLHGRQARLARKLGATACA